MPHLRPDTLSGVNDKVPGAQAADSAEPTPPLRFLVVDDSEDIRELMVRMVTRLGHSAEEAGDGVEATEALQAASYDFMLLDLSMPRMNGEEVVRWVREHPEHSEGLTIVVVSAWAGDKRPTLNELGVTKVLPKPFRQQQLADLIDD